MKLSTKGSALGLTNDLYLIYENIHSVLFNRHLEHEFLFSFQMEYFF